jgi:lipopolysaccharide transport system permease protein
MSTEQPVVVSPLEAPVRASYPAAPKKVPAVATEEQPLTVIEPRPGWRLLDLRELWQYRELLYFLAWRDIKVRYKQALFGAAWAVLQPLTMMIVFTLFFRRGAETAPKDVAYPLFLFSGLLPWMFFANTISQAGQSVVASQNLVRKIYFPRLVIPLGIIGAGLVDFLIAFGMLAVLMVWYGAVPGWSILLMPLLLLGLMIAAAGIGSLLAALTVAYRDFRYVVPFMIQLWMFATPSVYQSVDSLSPKWQSLLPLSPPFGLIANFRAAVLGRPFDFYALAVSTAVSLLLLAIGCMYFRRMERSFADIV